MKLRIIFFSLVYCYFYYSVVKIFTRNFWNYLYTVNSIVNDNYNLKYFPEFFKKNRWNIKFSRSEDKD